MKQNIFASAVPKTVDLPFATVEFMREPVKSDVTSLADLPTIVLNMVENRSAVVYQFYLKVLRKPEAKFQDIDMHRAEDLVQENVMTAIRQFGDTFGIDDGDKALDFDPHYPMMAYEISNPTPGKLRPDAHRQYWLELIGLAIPNHPVCHNPHTAAFGLNKSEHGIRLSLLLAPNLEMTVSTQETDTWASRHQGDPQFILGTAKMFGKKAYIQINPSFNSYNGERKIGNWLTQDVLHDAVQERLGIAFGELLGPLADDFIDTLLDGIAFDLA